FCSARVSFSLSRVCDRQRGTGVQSSADRSSHHVQIIRPRYRARSRCIKCGDSSEGVIHDLRAPSTFSLLLDLSLVIDLHIVYKFRVSNDSYKRALDAAVREYERATAEHAALETRLAQLK